MNLAWLRILLSGFHIFRHLIKTASVWTHHRKIWHWSRSSWFHWTFSHTDCAEFIILRHRQIDNQCGRKTPVPKKDKLVSSAVNALFCGRQKALLLLNIFDRSHQQWIVLCQLPDAVTKVYQTQTPMKTDEKYLGQDNVLKSPLFQWRFCVFVFELVDHRIYSPDYSIICPQH